MTPQERRQKCKKLTRELERIHRAYEKFMKKYHGKRLAARTQLREIRESCAHESHKTGVPDVCPDCYEDFRGLESYG